MLHRDNFIWAWMQLQFLQLDGIAVMKYNSLGAVFYVEYPVIVKFS